MKTFEEGSKKCTGVIPTDEQIKEWDSQKLDKSSIPRRSRLDLNTPAELAIRLAMYEVEKVGEDEKLTVAIVLLAKAKDCVADFVDKVNVKPEIHYYKCPECGAFNASDGTGLSWVEEQLKNIQIHLNPRYATPCRGKYVEITKEEFWELSLKQDMK